MSMSYIETKAMIRRSIDDGIIVRIEDLKEEDGFDYLGVSDGMIDKAVRVLLKENKNYMKGKILGYNYIMTRYARLRIENNINNVINRITTRER